MSIQARHILSARLKNIQELMDGQGLAGASESLITCLGNPETTRVFNGPSTTDVSLETDSGATPWTSNSRVIAVIAISV
jgi:hypothetical protein